MAPLLPAYFSRERRAQRRALKAARRADKDEVRRRKLALAEAKQERKLNETRRRIGMLAAMPADGPSAGGDYRVLRAPLRYHTEAHASPAHHVGTCDGACRAGLRAHAHREG